MHRHPLSIIKSSTGLEKLIKVASQVSPERMADERFQKVMAVYNGANALKLIHRFIDKRQPHLLEYPQRVDGSDILSTDINPQQSDILVYERRFQRLWIRFLHRKGLHRYEGRLPGGVQQSGTVARSLYELYGAGRLFLEEEIDSKRENRITDDYEIDLNDPASDTFQWMSTTRRVILTALEAMKAVALTPRPALSARFTMGPYSRAAPPGPQLTNEQLLDLNLGDTRILDGMVAVRYAFPNTTAFKGSFIWAPLCPLLMQL